MKTKYAIILTGLAAMAAATAQDTPAAPAAPAAQPAAPTVSQDQVKKALSYLVGYKTAQEFSAAAPGIEAADFDDATLVQAFKDGLAGNKPAISEAELQAALPVFQQTLQERQAKVAEENGKKGEAFMAEFAKKDGAVKTDSGLMYRVITKGEGKKYDPKEHGEYAVAMVKYRGTHTDGTEFDSSEEAVEMPLEGVVPGFSEALKLMPVGSKWEIAIPGNLAYGAEGRGPIGPNETLVFTLEVTDIQKGQAPAMPLQLTPEMLQQMQQQGMPTE